MGPDLLHLLDLDGLDELGNIAGQREHEQNDKQAHKGAPTDDAVQEPDAKCDLKRDVQDYKTLSLEEDARYDTDDTHRQTRSHDRRPSCSNPW